MAVKSIGVSVPRNDAYEKVTGRALYVADLKIQGMLHAKVLRPEYAHALIKAIDTSEAEKMPGVKKVVTGQGCSIHFGACYKDQQPLAVEKVRHAGDAVAVVVADTERHAEEALKAIKVTYEPLPHATDPLEAIKEGAALVHEKNGEYKVVPGFFPKKGTNIFHHYKLREGDTVKAFSECDAVVEGDFTYPLNAHSQMEPHGCIACWDSADSVRIWASSQAPFIIREMVADMFHIPFANIKVHVGFLGGAFGGKSDVSIEPMVAYVARFVPGVPVRLVLSRKEEFTSGFVGRGLRGKIKLGAKKDGTLHAIEASLYFADGAYADGACNVVQAAGYVATGPYVIPNCAINAIGVYTNTPSVGAFRGYGHPEAHFMAERAMDMLARKLSMTPEALRRKNFLCDGKRNALGQLITKGHGDIHKCLDGVEGVFKETKKPAHDDEFLYGRGIAAFMKTPMMTTNACSGAIVKFCEDGTVNISVSGVEMGQGSQTVLAQIAAETLKIPYENVRMSKTIDTQFSPHEWQTVASISTYRVGNAIIKACNEVIGKIMKAASQVLQLSEEDLVYEGEFIRSRVNVNAEVALPVKKLLLSYVAPDGKAIGEPIMGTGSHILRGMTFPDSETGRGSCAGQWTFGCQGAEVKVSRKTGKVTVTNLVTSIDVGKALNPELARAQMLGGMMMGYGAALSEEIVFDEKGKIKNPNFNTYKIPTMADMPEKYSVVFVETPQEDGPFGARCIAEHPAIAIPPALVNALYDALGVDFHAIPVTPKTILAALEGRN
ncbi:MAG: xanthine dehydrogenase family protein molybdopterin-binding subunit [Candidatus Eremiobacteraeota bacterium]|nr:xanthine dehydrogenase family protein molybdopterin-binding subunit [Candidatus Eremiobacteraeota bacterium]